MTKAPTGSVQVLFRWTSAGQNEQDSYITSKDIIDRMTLMNPVKRHSWRHVHSGVTSLLSCPSNRVFTNDRLTGAGLTSSLCRGIVGLLSANRTVQGREAQSRQAFYNEQCLCGAPSVVTMRIQNPGFGPHLELKMKLQGDQSKRDCAQFVLRYRRGPRVIILYTRCVCLQPACLHRCAGMAWMDPTENDRKKGTRPSQRSNSNIVVINNDDIQYLCFTNDSFTNKYGYFSVTRGHHRVNEAPSFACP